ncbi:MAG: 30S ribosomal protein S5 [Candidatus Omnitrophota bacterium]
MVQEKSAQPQVAKEYIEKIISINRVAKVTKGGKKLHFSALVIVGDGQGHVGLGLAKANEVASAIRKSIAKAKKSMISIPMVETTIPHAIIAEFGAAKVMLKPAMPGTGVIAAGCVRAICEAAGIKDILTKCLKSNNPINVTRATFAGFAQMKQAKK